MLSHGLFIFVLHALTILSNTGYSFRANIALRSNKYDNVKFEEYYSSRPVEVWERLVEIGSPLIGWYISRKFDNFTSIFRKKEENEKILNERANDLKESIVQVFNFI